MLSEANIYWKDIKTERFSLKNSKPIDPFKSYEKCYH